MWILWKQLLIQNRYLHFSMKLNNISRYSEKSHQIKSQFSVIGGHC